MDLKIDEASFKSFQIPVVATDKRCKYVEGRGTSGGPLIAYVKSVTGQLADKPTRGQSSRGLVNSRTSQLAEMFDLKFGVCIIALNVISD